MTGGRLSRGVRGAVAGDERCRVLLVSPLPPPAGGIARWTTQLLEQMPSFGDIEVVHVDIAPRWRAVHSTSIVLRLVGGLVQGVRDASHVCACLVSKRPDVAHLCTSGSLALLRDACLLLVARAVRLPVAYHVRMGRLSDAFASRNLESRVFGLVARMATAVVVLDAATEAALRRACPSVRVERIPNFISLQMPPASPQAGQSPRTPIELSYVGWVVASKGVVELIEAMARLPAGLTVLRLAGPVTDRFRRRLEERAKSLGVTVDVVGELSHPATLERIAQSDILVLPSHSEGFPNVILEAMALGRPVVATAVGAVREILGCDDADQCGIAVPPSDGNALFEALTVLCADVGFRGRLGAAGRRRVESRYSPGVVISAYVRLWKELAAKGRKCAGVPANTSTAV